MPTSIYAFCLAIVLGSVFYARLIGVTLPLTSINNPGFDRVIWTILISQSTLSYFAYLPAHLLTEKPRSFPGDLDGVLDQELLDDARRSSRGLISLTICITSTLLVIAKVACVDGVWKAELSKMDVVLLSIVGIGEAVCLIILISCKYRKAFSRGVRGEE